MMDFTSIEKTWNAPCTEGENIVLKPELLLRELKHNQRSFSRRIFWRDFREVGVAIPLAVFFAHAGWKSHAAWMFLFSSAALWVAGYLVFSRIKHRKRTRQHFSLLRNCIEESLADVREQIRLLDTVFWWYIFPFFPGILSAAIQNWVKGIPVFHQLGFTAGWFLVGGFVFWLNKRAVNRHLRPREKELEEMQRIIGPEGQEAQPE